MLLPDSGAKDGLRGERWAVHAGRWAQARGHKVKFFQLENHELSTELEKALRYPRKAL